MATQSIFNITSIPVLQWEDSFIKEWGRREGRFLIWTSEVFFLTLPQTVHTNPFKNQSHCKLMTQA